MTEENDDELYDPTYSAPSAETSKGPDTRSDETNMTTTEDKGQAQAQEEEEEEEEEEEDEDEDDFKIITDGPPEATIEQPSRHSVLRKESLRPSSTEATSTPKVSAPSIAPKVETATIPNAITAKPTVPQKPGSAYPAQHTSTIDINANPVHPTTSKPILSTDLDADFPTENDKPWRKPGSDMTDYFNYGFDEFTWASYCLKQDTLRKDIVDQKKQMDEMHAFLGAGLPGMPGPSPGPGPGTPNLMPSGGTSAPGPGPPQATGPPPPAMPGMAPGMPDMSQEMMQGMFTSMMAQGLDPASMDPMTFMQHAQAMMGGGQPGPVPGSGPGPGGPPGGQPGFAGQPPGQPFGGQPPMGYGGYEQRGGGFVRGKGGRRW
ncbi:pre-mRNA polyadenylation factor fip1 [Histoplasma capsulatum G186AR]|uniref:Pre-mRNA polyadenylation factor fip1 n=1 Tax=Ajellomyces capsulatus TaxID=5037 RepID=A0A8H8D2R2_AJECA|nr:pre-mRNA polyadenylation factor fip1 [Histoplasma capsulatum]QSS67100.1 pre-mRNA polyadenylation factor fip1 [Histoplasma capsulatum G186AR]